MTSFPSFRYDHVLWTGQVDCHRPQISLMKGTGSHSFCFHIRIARSYTHNRVKNLHMERHDDFPSARNQAASSQRSPNGKQNFLNNSRSVRSVGNSGSEGSGPGSGSWDAVRTNVYICICRTTFNIYIYKYIYIIIYICMYVCMYVWCVCMHVCIYIYIYYIYICIYRKVVFLYICIYGKGMRHCHEF